MKKPLLVFLAILAGGYFTDWGEATAQRKKHRGFSISSETKTITDCGQITVRIGDLEIARSEQERTIPMSAVSTLGARVVDRGGIQVTGWDRDYYSIKACLAAGGESPAEAQNLLSQLSLSVEGGQVSVSGPGNQDRVGYLIIHAPNGAALNLESKNAPIRISSFSGTVQGRTVNGPLSLFEVRGRVRANVVNGPIDVMGGGGDFQLEVQNGPLGVVLRGATWEGEMEGRTQNGPIMLKLPPDYQSSVRVDASKHSPVECRAVQCKEAVRTWDNPSRIQFGSSEPIVRLSTVNGPVTIKSGE